MQTILIIDDDAAIGNLEQEVLERAGYAVLRTYSGTEALLLLKDSRPDLVLLDLMLPGLSGEGGPAAASGHFRHCSQRQNGGAGQGRTAAGKIRPCSTASGADTPDCTEGSLKTHISNLRGKLRDATGKKTILKRSKEEPSMSKRTRQYIGILAALAAYYLVHEGAHLL